MAVVLSFSLKARAQDLEGADSASSTKDVEDVYDKEEIKQEKKTRPKIENKEQPKQVQTLSDLATLAPFSDVAVIQRRFLPKTGRFELSASAYTNLNNPFFNQFGVSPRVAYYLRERYALEVIGGFGTVSARQVTDDLLHNPPHISTDNVTSSRGFVVGAFKWNPVYGKITWLNKSIVPFDLNFDIGGGTSFLTGGDSAPTVHFGSSQIFALSKSMALRWDLAINHYWATIKDNSGNKTTTDQNDIFLGIGMSFYIPEATYR
jgi:outer membrane beta-barrel protein